MCKRYVRIKLKEEIPMISLKYFIYVFLLSALFVCNCAKVNEDKSITDEQLREEMKTNEHLIILDVRNPYELSGPLGYIKGAINIPVQELETRINELDEYKENDIMVICRSGRRSLIATNLLLERGFSAKNIIGGMKDFRTSKVEK